VSSFQHLHRIYLFSMRNGKKKLAYGQSPEDALEILRLRLTAEEMAQIIADEVVSIRPKTLRDYVHLLG
jgi:hypothetical protein